MFERTIAVTGLTGWHADVLRMLVANQSRAYGYSITETREALGDILAAIAPLVPWCEECEKHHGPDTPHKREMRKMAAYNPETD